MKQGNSKLIKAMKYAIENAIYFNQGVPQEIQEPIELLARLPPCQICNQYLSDELINTKMTEQWEEDLLQQILVRAVPARLRPIFRAIMVHTEQCEKT